MRHAGRKKFRVIHCGTGVTGIHGLRGVINHPDLELVGLYANSEDKIGKDAGEIAGGAPIGVTATNDIDELVGLKADCLNYMANGFGREKEVVDDLSRFLAAGTNAVTTSLLKMVVPEAAPDLRLPLEKACQAGNSSLYCAGQCPGMINDVLPITLLSMADEVKELRIQEVAYLGHYRVIPTLREFMGYGYPPEYKAPMWYGGTQEIAFVGLIHQLAEAMGREVDEITYSHESEATEVDLPDTPAGPISAGGVIAHRALLKGMVNGHPLIVIENISRIVPDAAPHWPPQVGKTQGSGHRLLITGNPSLICELDYGRTNGINGTLPATAMRSVNSIPEVCVQNSGIVKSLDLPYYLTKNTFPK
jgi:4-hydroxy-tetrahydrodipicolinate reductase